MSVSRAGWLVKWATGLIEAKVVRMCDFRSGLGRFGYAVGALELERPFLGPLYTFASVECNPGAIRPVPVFVLLILRFLCEQVKENRMYPCARPVAMAGEAFRVDAKAEGMTVQLGGWLPTRDPQGRIDKARSLWYSAVATRSNAPWAFDRDGQPFRLIASLEALALLVGFMVFVPIGDARLAGRTMAELPSWTDNRGNSFALTRLATTKFPLVCLAMELALQMRSRSTRLAVQWAPRELNEEADALTNLEFRGW